jgi:hypothetical protein
MLRLFAVATFSVLALLLPGATLERLTLNDMVRNSTAIVRGKVSSIYTAVSGRVVYTHYKIQVSEGWKGSDGGTVDVVVPGGATATLHQSFSGAPSLTSGTEYVLFLWRSRSGLNHLIGLSQGLFTLKTDASGTLTAVRSAASEPMLDASGKPVKSEDLSIPLAGLKSQVEQALSSPESK